VIGDRLGADRGRRDSGEPAAPDGAPAVVVEGLSKRFGDRGASGTESIVVLETLFARPVYVDDHGTSTADALACGADLH
jgi:hypothetical protein